MFVSLFNEWVYNFIVFFKSRNLPTIGTLEFKEVLMWGLSLNILTIWLYTWYKVVTIKIIFPGSRIENSGKAEKHLTSRHWHIFNFIVTIHSQNTIALIFACFAWHSGCCSMERRSKINTSWSGCPIDLKFGQKL